jgi:hypothetical protein
MNLSVGDGGGEPDTYELRISGSGCQQLKA